MGELFRLVSGSPGIHATWQAQGIPRERKRVGFLMRQARLSAHGRRPRVVPPRAHPQARVPEKELDGEVEAEQPNQKGG